MADHPTYKMNLDRRRRRDRRSQGNFKIRSLLNEGSRSMIRRQDDRSRIFYQDRYSSDLFAAIIIIIFLSAIDALFSLLLIDLGAVEMNPVMNYSLKLGPYAFLAVKLTFTSAGLIILLMLRNIILKGIKTYSLLYFFIGVFVTVVTWELFLIYHHLV